MSAGGGPGRREVAVRFFAAVYDDAEYEYSESDEERAPNYVVTPTGARVNRLFVVGVLTEVEAVSDDVLRARVVDPTGAFVVYAGQYQPDAKTFLERADPPGFVAVTGKARTFEPDDGDRVYTSVRPESIAAVDAATRDRWTVQAAEHTIDRVGAAAAALDRTERGDDLREVLLSAGVDPALAAGIPRAIEHYGTTEAYLAAVRAMAVQAAEVVTGDREEVEPLDVEPGETGPVETALAADFDIEAAETAAAEGPSPSPDPPAAADETGPAAAAEATGDEPPAADPPAQTDPDPAEGEPPTGGAPDDEPDVAPGEGPATDEPFELDEEERAAVEAEYGTEFATGTEVDAPGEADIETPGPIEEGAEETEPAEPAADEEPSEEGAEPAADEDDLEDAVVAIMGELDEGDGADREAVIAAAVEESGAEPDAVEEAIQDALIGGRCYEPADGRLKPI